MQVASCFTSWGGMELHLLNLSDQLRARGHRVIVAAQPGGWVLPRAQAMGLETFEATVRRQQDWHDFGRYRAFLRREKVDIIHTHTNWDAVVPSVAARLAGVPVAVMTWHLPAPFKSRRGGALLLSLLYKRMIAISGSVRDRHVRHGVPARRAWKKCVPALGCRLMRPVWASSGASQMRRGMTTCWKRSACFALLTATFTWWWSVTARN